MKVKLILVKRLRKNVNNLQKENKLNIYFFIEKLFFILTDLLNFYKLCFIYKLYYFKKFDKLNIIIFNNYYILGSNDLTFCYNQYKIFDLCEYSFKVTGLFFYNKKCLINNALNNYNFFKIILIYYKTYYLSLNYIIFFINITKYFNNLINSLLNFYLKNFTIMFKGLF